MNKSKYLVSDGFVKITVKLISCGVHKAGLLENVVLL